MKKILLALFLLTAYTAQAQTAASLQPFQWLNGDWRRTNAKPGSSGMEKWVTVSTTEMQGRGINMKGQDTGFVEKIKLVVKDGAVFYVADVPGNQAPVYFKMTAISENSFTCENPDHDFPKKIQYQKEGNRLKATISGDGKSMDFLFEKIQ